MEKSSAIDLDSKIGMTKTASDQLISTGEIVLYQPEGSVKLEVRVENETVWLMQAQMASLFERERSVIAKHIGNVFKEKELYERSNVQILHNTLSKYKPTTIYSLDVII